MINYRFLKSIFIIFIFIIATQKCFSQRFDSILNKLDTAYPQEKVYLHFDRAYYNPGETIWFKAYLTSANLPSAISQNLYAELLDAKGKILQRKTMPLLQATAASYFTLPDSMINSLVYVRAYTAWMLNFDSAFLFIKPIQIINAIHQPKKNIVAPTYSLHFFPEGGDLVNNTTSHVAFKANDQDGKPIFVSGNIIDANGNKITTFTSVHDGMGYFSFAPTTGNNYKAVWKDKNGLPHETSLPIAKKEGVVLSIHNQNNNITFTLTRPNNVDDAFTSYYVVAQIQQQLIYSATVNMTKKTIVSAPIPTDSLPDGIVQVTVFNAAQIPVAERLFFVNHGAYYFVTDLHAIEKNITKKGHNTLQVDVGGTLFSNLSIAVTDEDLNPAEPEKEETIFSNLLLTSDLKGSVYNPGYYFTNDDDSIKQQLDLVMMTNGWRRFKWEDLLANKWSTINHLPEHALFIKGNVYGLTPNLLSGVELTGILKTKNGGQQILSFPLAKDGSFKSDKINFFDTAKMYYQFNNDKDKKLTAMASFLIESDFVKSPAQLFPISMYSTTEPDSSTANKNRVVANFLRQAYFNGHKIKSLNEIIVTTRQKTPQEKIDQEYTSGLFSGSDATVFINNNDSLSRFGQDVLSYLQGKVAGLNISTIGDGNVSWRNSTTSLYMNEMSVDLNQIKNISMSNVAMIKIFRPPFLGDFGGKAAGGAGGAIAVYTKKGGNTDANAKGLDYATINGYSSIKEFYSPDYSSNATSLANDYRTTLYWNPFLLMDKNNRRITIPFYNSDGCKKIRVVIEGINELGQLTREEKVF